MKPGDIIACHGSGFVSRAIQLGQWIRCLTQHVLVRLRLRKKLPLPWSACRYNHIAIYAGTDLDGHDVVYQATGRGVVCSDLSDLGSDIKVIDLDSYPTINDEPADRDRMLVKAMSLVDRRYGFLTIASEAVNILTPSVVDFRVRDTYICSALAAVCMLAAGVDVSTSDLYQTIPAEIVALSEKEAA